MVATFIWTLLLSTMLAGFAGDDAPRAVFPSILLVQQTVEIPQLQFICVVVVFLDVTHMPSLMVQTSSSDHRDSPVARLQGGQCPCYAGCAGSSGSLW